MIGLEALKKSSRHPAQRGSSSAASLVFCSNCSVSRDDIIMLDAAKAYKVGLGLITPRSYAALSSTLMSDL